MGTALQSSLQAEEQLVAELAKLGVRYLSRQSADSSPSVHTPHELLAMLVCQPSSRVRAALIALLLARPDYASYVSQALTGLKIKDAQTLRFFYTAAVNLQQEYEGIFQAALGVNWYKLPDLFSDELGLTGVLPAARLQHLAHLHAQSCGENLNWEGTYENAAQHLIRRWKMEQTWQA